MTRPIYDLPQAKPMNARLWTGEVPSTPITPVGGKRLGDPGDDARGLSGFDTVSELPDTDELGPRIEIALGSRE